MRKLLITGLFFLVGCANGPSGSTNRIDFSTGVIDTPFTIQSESELIGGPIAMGKVGDVLLQNDKIKIVIMKPGNLPWVANFGGGIIDADIVRANGEGQDNFQFMQPLINIEWTVNVFNYEVISDGADGGAKVFRTYGVIDEYDYLDLDFISPVAKAITGQNLYISARFDDVNDPFRLTDLAGINNTVVTDYILEPDKNYVTIKTTFENTGNEKVYVPVGDFVNGGGEVQYLIPGLGFTPDLMPQIQGDTTAMLYVAFPESDVSYGYFYNIDEFTEENADGTLVRTKSTSLSYSGVAGILLGEDFLKVLPLGNNTEPKMNFSVPPHGTRTMTRYFVVGNGNGGSVFDAGMSVLGISTNSVSGVVKNSSGETVAGATVAVQNEDGSTVITYRTDSKGRFSGNLSRGAASRDAIFGSGKYKLAVYKKGHRVVGEDVSGKCDHETLDLQRSSVTGVTCTLGDGGLVKVSGGVVDADSGKKIPARMTIIGPSASYRTKNGFSFEDDVIFHRPLGVVDVYYVNAKGTFGINGEDAIPLSPGKYELVFSRGTEYSIEKIPVEIKGNEPVTVGPVSLKRVIDTIGFVSADFHLHSIASPDSAIRPERRVLAAAGEGMDVLQSSDHDYNVDYSSYVSKLEGQGIISSATFLSTIVGDEISPNSIGHFNIFPMPYDENLPGNGSLDWGHVPDDVVGPSPDYVMSPNDVAAWARALPGDSVIQMNHLADLPTSLLVLGGWVTTPFYNEAFGVETLSSYADPGGMRIMPKTNSAGMPLKLGSSDIVVTDFDTMELVIGPELHDNLLLTSALPTWFNFLNLGLIYTATGDSDSHREIADPMGLPRNFIETSDLSFDVGSYTAAIKQHKVLVTTGPFVKVMATGNDGNTATVGGEVVGKKVKIKVSVTSPSWAWFDTIEIYANTEPVPADDESLVPIEGAAADPATFFAPYHVTRYYYKPTNVFRLKDKTLTNWEEKDGVIKAEVELELDVDKDTWVVVFVKGTEETEGYRSLFPFVTHALVDADNPSAQPADVDIGNINTLSLTGAPAWAFTNPVFIDVDGDGFKGLNQDKWGLSKSDVVVPHHDHGDTITITPKEEKAGVKAAPRSATSANSALMSF